MSQGLGRGRGRVGAGVQKHFQGTRAGRGQYPQKTPGRSLRELTLPALVSCGVVHSEDPKA